MFKEIKFLKSIKLKNIEYERGSYEIWEWVRDYYYITSFDFFTQFIYSRFVYRMLRDCCNDEQLYDMLVNINKYGSVDGLMHFIFQMQNFIKMEDFKKKDMIKAQLNKEKVDNIKLDIAILREKEIARIQEEKRKKMEYDKYYEEFQGKILEQGNDLDIGVGYVIFDNTEIGKYFGIVTSIYRHDKARREGGDTYIGIAHDDLDMLKMGISQMYLEEKVIQNNYNLEKKVREMKKDYESVDIDHVKRAMGMGDFNEDFSGDIF